MNYKYYYYDKMYGMLGYTYIYKVIEISTSIIFIQTVGEKHKKQLFRSVFKHWGGVRMKKEEFDANYDLSILDTTKIYI